MDTARDPASLAMKWLRSVVAVLVMAHALAFGLFVVARGVPQFPDMIRRGDLPLALGVVLVVTMCVALFSIGAHLWVRCRSTRPARAATWQRVFHLSCGLAVGLMLLILTVSVVARL